MSNVENAETSELLAVVTPKSSVRIDTNAKGQSQVKVNVYDGVTEEEMERLSALALKTYTDLQASTGKLARF
jgi:hypothetical protein